VTNPDLPSAPLYVALGQALRVLRKRAGLTQLETAERVGIRSTFVSQIENGARGMRFHTMMAMLEAYGADLGDLDLEFKLAAA
jgi:transcriptional regulator with XRE-family HTH domain